MKNLFLIVSLLLGLSFSVEWYENGADGGWIIVDGNVTANTYNSYSDSMTGYGFVVDGDGNDIADQGSLSDASDGDLIGIFDPNGDLRGVNAAKLDYPSAPYQNYALFSLFQ